MAVAYEREREREGSAYGSIWQQRREGSSTEEMGLRLWQQRRGGSSAYDSRGDEVTSQRAAEERGFSIWQLRRGGSSAEEMELSI